MGVKFILNRGLELGADSEPAVPLREVAPTEALVKLGAQEVEVLNAGLVGVNFAEQLLYALPNVSLLHPRSPFRVNLDSNASQPAD